MSLNPSDIESHRFREAFRGYDKDDVDEFLDRVSDRINELLVERQRVQDRMEAIEADAAESVEAERLLKRTLITAQRTADETVSEAREEADRMRAEAERSAAEIVQDAEQRATAAIEDATSRAEAAVQDAEERARHRVQEAEERAADVLVSAERRATRDLEEARAHLERARGAVADLERLRSEYRDRVRAVIAEQLDALDRIGDLPEVPEELVALRDQADADATALDAARPEVDDSSEAGAEPDIAASGESDEGFGTMPAPEVPGTGDSGEQQTLEPGNDTGENDQTRLIADDEMYERGARPMMGRRAARRRERSGRPAPEATEHEERA